ncbi:LacI family DNA-binding transcriptional regulator [Granulosicoccus antarcticus]|uniref:Catabolite control protein A n=1 Tax=Granulosicoccus antarcticus IMCC3135 TaxID=1192854 RepID=A0A2Z2NZZ2_9GAMM|nr:LacI family DNA-binding transcriptional regulator [Granulosicoccus antarcticus]ASJ73417.1 Catabolite control protein A [Granulosicoccus antarcticus IMCC3135]
MGRVTIKSIGKDLGISHMTVSRALSGHPNVQKATREAVLKRAQELGYVKSAAANTMRGDKTDIVGLLLPNIINEFYARFANTLSQCCRERSLHLIIHLTGDDTELERKSLERLCEVQARAVVMVPAPGESKDLETLLKSMRVIQLIRQRPMSTPSFALLVDDHSALHDAVVELARRGHQSIGYIGADAGLSSGRERLQAFKHGLKSAKLKWTKRFVLTGAPSFEMGRYNTVKLLDAGEVTAMVCGGFEISNGALSVLMEREIHPSRDIGFVGYGDPSFYARVNGGVSTIEVPVDELALRASELLAEDSSAQTEASPETVELGARLLLRGNLRIT